MVSACALLVAAGLAGAAVVPGGGAAPQAPPQAPVFRGGIDLVTLRAVVRDRRGRPVTNLGPTDFEVFDRGLARTISAFDKEPGPIGLALLFDVSGSMGLAERFTQAKMAGYFLLSSLRNGQDEAAIFAFDSSLREVQPFTSEIDRLRGTLTGLDAWGATSLHDAIASAARTMTHRAVRRRALIVLTDGIDTSSRLTPAQVSGIAAAIDLPVYLVTVVLPVDDPREADRGGQPAVPGSLADLARWTGGDMFIVSTTSETSQIARRIVDEMRHQYLIAFEPSREAGWHPLEVRIRRRGHTVQSRAGYVAGG